MRYFKKVCSPLNVPPTPYTVSYTLTDRDVSNWDLVNKKWAVTQGASPLRTHPLPSAARACACLLAPHARTRGATRTGGGRAAPHPLTTLALLATAAGAFGVSVGSSSQDIRLTGKLTV